ncbi:hypothetical protein D7Z54_29905 [Salibacterium salarium]|uniref:Uncharacterized protein n=1 Tax=Salibacterium salarium TaxID=284579 RepID=A0A428MU99_9BACI|nr:hypothetical protein [Salibacterium salarium]RSL29698.1 hypothetical protein D7Z54_29905 [Salibacterium salarium]
MRFLWNRRKKKSDLPSMQESQEKSVKEPEVSVEDLYQEMIKDGVRFKKAETFEEMYSGPLSILPKEKTSKNRIQSIVKKIMKK